MIKSNHEAHILHTALSPVFHQSPNTGSGSKNVSYQRMIPMIGQRQDGKFEYVMVPGISGNARRSLARRDLIMETLQILGVYKDHRYDTDMVRSDLIMAFINGGSMAASESALNPKIKAKQETYEMLPFFGLFGGCYRQVWFAGRLSAGFAYTLTPETCKVAQIGPFPFNIEADKLPDWDTDKKDFYNRQEYTRQRVPGLVAEDRLNALLTRLQEGEQVKVAEKIAEYSAETSEEIREELKYLIETNSGAKEIIEKFFESKNTKKKQKDLVDQIPSIFGNQMIYAVDRPIPAGAKLYASDYLLPGPGNDDLYEAVFHAYLEKLAARPFLGGMAAKGYGRVVMEIKNADGQSFTEFSRANEYWTWLRENKEEVRAYLKNYDKHLFNID